MRVREADRTIELSERNLRSLLVKMNGHPPNSACSIARDGWVVVAMPDEQHYKGRRPGSIHPDTKRHLMELS